MVSLILRK